MRPENARDVAATVLTRVADQGAYAMRALDAELGRAGLAPRDAALATEIVYGTLRVLPDLDAAIAPFLKRDAEGMDPLTRAVLRAAVYQLRHLSRVPPHAVVDDAVTFVRRARGPKVGGFANAVLRKLAVIRPENPSPPAAAVVPAWLRQALSEALTPEQLMGFLAAPGEAPPLGLCVPHGRRDELANALRAALPDADVQAGMLASHALLLRRAGDPRRLPGYGDGRMFVQEEGAQVVAAAVGAQPGERIADVCAGHGGKSLSLANHMQAHGSLCSVDVDEAKLARIPHELARLGLDRVAFSSEAVDLRVGTGGLGATFDRVLVDAPCSGLGTVHRRPELLLRLGPDDLVRMATVQTEILLSAIRLIRPGGHLTYAVCSLSRAEGVAVAEAVEAVNPGLRRLDAAAHLPEIEADSDGVLRIGPWLEKGASRPDGYQVISWHLTA